MNWETTVLSDVCLKISSGGTPSREKSDYYLNGTIPWVKSKELLSCIIRDTEEKITEIGSKNSSAKIYRKNTVLLAMYGVNIGQVGYLGIDAAINQAICAIVPNEEQLSPQFLYHYLTSIPSYFHSISFGAAQQNINQDIIKRLKLVLPPLPIQNRIAAILSAYDELIEVNAERIRLLEDTARELYKEWFVRLRFPGYKEAGFVKGVPEGWAIKKIKEISDYINRGLSPVYEDNGKSLVLNQRCIRDNKVNILTGRRQSKPVPLAKQLRLGDVLINSTGEGTLGRTAQLHEMIEGLTADSHLTIARAAPSIPIEFYGLAVMALEQYFELMALGSTGQTELSRKAIENATVIVPTVTLMEGFSKIVKPINQQVLLLTKQSTHLRQIRDRLLPRLISGKLQLKEEVPAKNARIISLTPQAMVAEAAPEYNANKKSNPLFTRRVLAAYIINKLYAELTFGHVKLMKLMYLCEHLADIETAAHYHRDAAGPYDNRMMRSIDSQLKKAGWFEAIKQSTAKYASYKYFPLKKKDEYKPWFQKYFSEQQPGIDRLIALFGTKVTEKVEMVATLFEAWRYLVEEQNVEHPGDTAIVHEVLKNWHESKARIPESKWRACLTWMREEQDWIS